MDNFQKEFLMNMFLDSDNDCNMNRLVVAVANIVKENCENMTRFSNLQQEFAQLSDIREYLGALPLPRRVKGFYEQAVLNFTDEDYNVKFKMKKTTVQVFVYCYYKISSK